MRSSTRYERTDMIGLTLFLTACTATKPETGLGDTATGAPPTVVLESPAEGDAVRGSFRMTGTATDAESSPSSLEIRTKPDPLGGTAFGAWQAVPGDGSWDVTLPEQPAGMQNLEVEVRDPEGNIGTDAVTVWVNDPHAPEVTILVPTDGSAVLSGSLLQMRAEIVDAVGAGPWDVRWNLSSDSANVLQGCDGTMGSPTLCSWTAEIGEWSLYVVAANAGGVEGLAHLEFSVVAEEDYDDDGDGWSEAEGDCDDTDASVGLASLHAYVDDDRDGYGDGETWLCTMTFGHSTVDGDCDDRDATVFPGSVETCNATDDDCDGVVDNDVVDAVNWYPDGDGDGVGTGVGYKGCWTAGYSTTNTDCNDTDATIYPGAPEFCDGVDHDCDGMVLEDSSVDALSQYPDADGDGYGDALVPSMNCVLQTGFSTDATDCDDTQDAVHPGATEVCNLADDDCDGMVDEADAADAGTYYADADGDGYGDAAASQRACTPPIGYVSGDDDCDDRNALVNPAVTEVCDNLDANCDGVVDTELAPFWYIDGDGDGAGEDRTGIQDCFAMAGRVSLGGDCDDTDGGIQPGAPEICDGVDQNCDGTVDENATDGTDWYRDLDGDGYGDAGNSQRSCTKPAWYVADDSDCDDQNPACYPGNTELCDNLDNDCDGLIDDTAVGAVTYYLDADADGYGVSASYQVACSAPDGYTLIPNDCDDANANVSPAAPEKCDGVDNDCDGQVDPNTSPYATTWYKDADNDAFGDSGKSTRSCNAPSGYVNNNSDCDDTKATVYPNALEYCDGVDHDCDGSRNETTSVDAGTWYTDSDKDTYGGSTSQKSCSQPAGTSPLNTDCDDGNAAVNPGAQEVCDSKNVDEDCDRLADDADSSVYNQVSYYLDTDGDGYGDSSRSTRSCETPAGYVTANGDCNDADAVMSPGVAEVCDTLDNDCDGTVNDAMMDKYEPNDSSGAAYLLSSTPIDAASVTFDVTLHESTDVDFFSWTTNDVRDYAHPAYATRLKISIVNPSSIPVSFAVTDTYHNITSLQSSTISKSASWVVPTSLTTANEESWRISLTPDTSNGWSISTCGSTITITITEY